MSVPPLKTLFGDIADAIRSKKETSSSIEAVNFPSEILSIPAGGSSTQPLDESQPVVVWIYRDMVTGKDKVVRTNPVNGNAVPPSDAGNVQANAGENPALTFQGWNHSSQDMQNVTRDMCIGAMYITADSKTHLYVSLNQATGLSHTLNVRSTAGNTVTIDWGDGTPNDTFAGTGSAQTHTYANYGTYAVKVWVSAGTGNLLLGGGSSSTIVWGADVRARNDSLFAAFLGSAVQIQIYAFHYTKLRTISIPSGVASLNACAFYYCQSLTTVSIPSGVTSLGTSVFNSCFSLTTASIPSSVTSLEDNAFCGCYSLTTVTIPSNVTSLGTSLFNNCYSLTAISIPSGITSIALTMFTNCYSLTTVSIPSSVISIGSGAFNNCYSLNAISIPSGVTSIGGSAFNNCQSLAAISIPSGVKSIASSTFSGCYSLTAISIPSGVTSIASNAFGNCHSLNSTTFNSIVPPTMTDVNTFSAMPASNNIYVPDASLNDYKTATNWIIHAYHIHPISELTA